MEKNFSMEDIQRLARSDAAQQLFALLQAQNGAALNQAMAQASSGDMAQAKKSLEALLSSGQAQALLKQLGG